MNSSEIEIRAPSEADRGAWERLWQAYLEFYRSTLADEVTDLLWRRILDPEHDIRCRIAVDADAGPVGLVHFFPHLHTWYPGPVCYLNDLFVSPRTRGGGVGEKLIHAVVDEARRQDWSEVYWLTQHDNAVARGLYDKITGGADGFVAYTIAVKE